MLPSPSASHLYLMSTPPTRQICDSFSSPDLPSFTELCSHKSKDQVLKHHSTSRSRPLTAGLLDTKTSLLDKEFYIAESVSHNSSKPEPSKENSRRKPLQDPNDRCGSERRTVGLNQNLAAGSLPPRKKMRSEKDAVPTSINVKTWQETLPIAKSMKVQGKKNAKADESRQTKIGKAKIKKPGMEKSVGERSKLKQVEKKEQDVDRRPQTTNTKVDAIAIADSKCSVDKTLVRADAMIRKRDWTPAKDTDLPESEQESEVTRNADNIHEHAHTSSLFGRSLESFGFAETVSEGHCPRSNQQGLEEISMVKRKPLELFNTSGQQIARTEQSKRNRSPQKRNQTITEKATAPFTDSEGCGNTLLDFFEPKLASDAISSSSKVAMTNSENRKFKRPKSSKKKTTVCTTRVLSPHAAIKKAHEQDLLFGTSSQLARDESPSYLRDLQQAIRVSECDSEPMDYAVTKMAAKSDTCAATTSQTKGMWSAAARDSDELLVEGDRLSATRKTVLSTVEPPSHPAVDEFLDVSTLGTGEASTAPDGRGKLQLQSSQAKDETDPGKGLVSTMPVYSGFTDNQLKRELSSYGFKPIKKRTDMISMLERCWKDKQRNVSLSAARCQSSKTLSVPASEVSDVNQARLSGSKTNPISGKSKLEGAHIQPHIPTKRPRGRPPKIKPPGQEHHKERPDGEKMSMDSVEAEVEKSRCDVHREQLFSEITSMIKGQPPTHDVTKLTWHEKMLMYDPIVIEDLTSWLRSKGIVGLSKGNKESFLLVKNWCEANSVCCLWKENLQREGRSRH